jgi:alcohol dehydrogenase class IV
MQFKFYIGTKVFFGKNCIKNNGMELKDLGKKAMIVTGKNSGKMSGALDDVIDILKEMKIDYIIYDKMGNNPSLEMVEDAGASARQFKPDFIVGIGGGSPLDAAKAVAVLAVNEIRPLDLYKNIFKNKPLPIIAIPTTVGTGSEITPYSILTREDIRTKKSFGNEDLFPKVAFVDARYIESMPYSVMVNTAADALSHAVEGYLSKRSTQISDLFALESIRLFGECAESLINNTVDFDTRGKLMYMALLGGMVISHTGTTFVHAIGYNFTYFKDIPHGKANGLLLEEYLKFNYGVLKDKIDRILQMLKLKDLNEFGRMMDRLLECDLELTREELELYVSIASEQKNVQYSAIRPTKDELAEIIRKSVRML